MRWASAITAAVGAGAVGVSGSAAAVASTSTSSSVCSGVDYCRVVSRADVDGDGRVDQIGLVEYGDEDTTTRSVVRVRTATGRSMRRTIDGYWAGRTSWHGSAAIDGQRGYELVLGKDTGAHAMFFAVLTYRNGNLTVLKAPGGQWTWYIDSSYAYNLGWHRTMSSGLQVTAIGSVRDHDVSTSRPHRQTKTRYRWSGGRWIKTGSSAAWVSSSAAGRASGWHVPYLKQFPSY